MWRRSCTDTRDKDAAPVGSSKNPIGDMMVKISMCEANNIPFANFAVGSPSFEPPDAVLKAFYSVTANTAPGSFTYTNPAGVLELRKLIASEVVGPKQGHVAVSARNIILTPGAQTALVNVSHSILSKKDAVVLTAPIYTYFKRNVELCRGVCHIADCNPSSFDINVKSLIKAMKKAGKHMKAIMLCSPGNPSGNVIQEKALQEIICHVNAHRQKFNRRVWIVMDHTYWIKWLAVS
mmetsp:Transcript_27870/g.51918  ORF Transcript_27870/g.51918 Transcript_27870/m.51918 type:complete len:236 (-) Transcript_27870:215-922(-)